MRYVSAWIVAASLVVGGLALWQSPQAFAEEHKDAATATGTSTCAQCSEPIAGHDVMLNLSEKVRLVLKGSGENYKKAHSVRKQGKKMTAVLKGELQVKKDDNGDPYLCSKVEKIKIHD